MDEKARSRREADASKKAPGEPSPPPVVSPEVAERVSIACPYCKGSLPRAEAVYCAACVAPHHADCWDQHGRCSACAATSRVRAEAAPARPRPKRAPVAVVLGLGLAAFLAGGATFFLRARSPLPPPVVVPDTKPAEIAAREWEVFARASANEVAGIRNDLERARTLLGSGKRDEARQLVASCAVHRQHLEELGAKLVSAATDEQRLEWKARLEELRIEIAALDERIAAVPANAPDAAPSSTAAADLALVQSIAEKREVDRYDEALRAIDRIPRGSPELSDAEVYRAWILADRAVRDSKADYDRGDYPKARQRLLGALSASSSFGPDAKKSITRRYEAWGAVDSKARELRRHLHQDGARAVADEIAKLEPGEENAYARHARRVHEALGAAPGLDAAQAHERALAAVARASWDEVRVYRHAGLAKGQADPHLDETIAEALGPTLDAARGVAPAPPGVTPLDVLDALELARDLGLRLPGGVDLDALEEALERGAPPPASPGGK